MAIGHLLLILLSPLLWGGPPQAVAVHVDGSTTCLTLAVGRQPAVDDSMRAIWVWSPLAAPRRLSPDQLADVQLAGETRVLQVGLSPGSRAETEDKSWALLAAPEEMWSEVPEPWLPRFRLSAGATARIPVDAERPWRLRLLSEAHGGWWIRVPAGASSVVVQPFAADDLQWRVLDPEGLGVEGASLRLEPAARRQAERSWTVLRTGVDGQAMVEALPDFEPLRLTVAAPGLVPAVFEGLPSSLPRTVRLELGSSLVGRVSSEPATPLASALVRVSSYLPGSTGRSLLRPTRTDEGGRWRLDGLPRGEVSVLIEAPGRAPVRRSLVLTESLHDLGTIVLEEALTVPVWVSDDLGAPVPAAEILGPGGSRALTDGSGQAQVGGFLPGIAARIAVTAKGYLRSEARVEAPAGEPVRVELRRSVRLTGRFLAPSLEPVRDGEARLEIGSSSTLFAVAVDGRFEVDVPPRKAAQLTLASPATAELRVGIDPGEPGEERDLGDLRAPAGLEIRGRLIRAGSGEPVAGARIWAPRISASGALLAWAQGDLLRAQSDLDGVFRLHGASALPIELRIEAPGLARRSLAVSPEPAGDTVDLGVIELEAGARVVVLVEDDPGRGAVARVDLRGEWLQPDMLTAPVVDGRAELSQVPAGPALVTVVQGDHLLCEQAVVVESGQDRTEVRCLDSSITVRGLVAIGGRRAGAGTLVWDVGTASARHGVIMTSTLDGGLRRQEVFSGGRPQVRVEVGDDGGFESRDLSAGSWRVSFSPLVAGPTRPRQIMLPEATEVEIQLDFPGLLVEGQVLDERGSPVVGARVREISAGGFALTDTEGRFALSGLEPGVRRLHARQRQRSSEVAEVLLEEGQVPPPVVLTVREELDRITLQALGVDGQPLPGAFFFLDLDGELRLLTADQDGRADGVVTPPYPGQVRVAAFAGSWALGPWLEWDEARAGLSVLLEESGSMRVLSETGSGPLGIAGHGWDVAALMRRLGLRAELAPGTPLVIHGLPPGRYQLSRLGQSFEVRVESNRTQELELP